uniref:Uncharacterized protein n=1 Tax=Trichuris muris TaxID=70415 RepID=A0A5S6Q9Q8_TRIMR
MYSEDYLYPFLKVSVVELSITTKQKLTSSVTVPRHHMGTGYKKGMQDDGGRILLSIVASMVIRLRATEANMEYPGGAPTMGIQLVTGFDGSVLGAAQRLRMVESTCELCNFCDRRSCDWIRGSSRRFGRASWLFLTFSVDPFMAQRKLVFLAGEVSEKVPA